MLQRLNTNAKIKHFFLFIFVLNLIYIIKQQLLLIKINQTIIPSFSCEKIIIFNQHLKLQRHVSDLSIYIYDIKLFIILLFLIFFLNMYDVNLLNIKRFYQFAMDDN